MLFNVITLLYQSAHSAWVNWNWRPITGRRPGTGHCGARRQAGTGQHWALECLPHGRHWAALGTKVLAKVWAPLGDCVAAWTIFCSKHDVGEEFLVSSARLLFVSHIGTNFNRFLPADACFACIFFRALEHWAPALLASGWHWRTLGTGVPADRRALASTGTGVPGRR